MKIRNGLILFFCFLMAGGLFAQEENIFWNREFWKAKPSLETVKEKVAEGHDPSALTAFGFDAVTSALFSEADAEIVKYLLSQKGNGVNKLTHDGRNYIFWAAYKGNLDIMQYLLEKGSRTDIIDDKGYSLLTFTAVVGQKNPELYDLIIKNGADIKNEKSKDGANVLLLLIPHLSDFEMVDYFAKKGLNIHDKDNYGNGTFNYTARTGNMDMLKKLVEKGVDYKTSNKNGGNAFIFASEGARGVVNGLEVYNYLESLGLEPNVTTKSGANPLHNIAYDTKDSKVFDFFISKGTDLNQEDENGNTAFLNASAYNTLDVIKYLLPKIKDVNHSNNSGETALTKAVARNNAEAVSFLIQKGAKANIKDKKGNNLGYYLVDSYSPSEEEDFYVKAKVLNENGVDFSAPQTKNNTLLHIAIEKQDLKLLQFLTKHGIDINAANADGLTVLHIAAMKAKDGTLLKYLLQQGAKKELKTDFDETAYDLASENELLQANNVNIEFLK